MVSKKDKYKSVWTDIQGPGKNKVSYKKYIYCSVCKKKVQVKNFNQGLCPKCGYGKNKRKPEAGQIDTNHTHHY